MSLEATPDTRYEDDLWALVDPPASRRLLAAALTCFAEWGYHGSTTRRIAEHAGMSPGAVYVHFATKAELLWAISRVGHESALVALESANDATVADPRERVERIVRAFASWHARHHRLARVVQYELDTLPPQRRRDIKRMRARFSAHVERELTAGVEAGTFGPIDIQGATLAILSLCIDIARWYGPTAARRPDELGAMYAEIVTRALRT